ERNGRAASEQPGRLLDALHGQPVLQGAPAHARAGGGHVLLHPGGAGGAGRHGGPLVLQRRARPAGDHRGDPAAGGGAGLRAHIPARPPRRLRGGGALGGDAARRAGPRVFHQLRQRERRHGAEDRVGLPQGARRGRSHAADRAGARLPRGGLRRHVGGRHRAEPQAVRRLAALRGPPAAHPRDRRQPLEPRPAGGRRRAGRRAGIAGRAARGGDDRGGDGGAGGGLHRRAGAAARLPGAAARDLHQARHPAHLRRGHHRLRPPRHELRRRAPGRGPGHHDHGQGPDQRRRAHGRRGGAGRGVPRPHRRRAGRDRAVPRLHLLRPPIGGGGGHRHHGVAPERRPAGTGAGDRDGMAGRGAFHARPAARHRRPRLRADRRHRDGAAAGRRRPAGARRVPALLRRRRAGPRHRRHRRAVAAADRGEAAHGPHLRHLVGRDPGGGL
ncbi:MAG: Omega-amino acid--pyruvate aminotransferase, partial [uncultured Acetobacteraceae bacterium]